MALTTFGPPSAAALLSAMYIRPRLHQSAAPRRSWGIRATQWGIGDADSWIPGTFSGLGAATRYDDDHQPKPSYVAVVNALGGTATSSSPTSGRRRPAVQGHPVG